MLQLIKKHKTPISHLFIWLIIFVLLLLILPNRFGQNNGVARSFFMTIAYGSLILINTQWLLPRFFNKKKYPAFFGLCLVLFVAVYGYFYLVYSYAIDLQMPERFHEMKSQSDFKPNNHFPIFGDMMIGVLIFITSIAFKSSQLAVLKEKETIQLKNENLNTELKFLRSHA